MDSGYHADTEPLPRYAGKGFALDCLSHGVRMNATSGLPADTSYLQLRAGDIVCGGAPTPAGYALAAILVVLHLALLLGPIGVNVAFFAQARARAFGATPLRCFEALLAAMGVFSIASFGEIAQHNHDSWLFVGLFTSFDIAAFYGALTLGQALLTWAVAGLGVAALVALGAGGVALTTLILGTFATANAQDPTLFVVLGFPIGVQIVQWALTFLSLTIATGLFIRACFRSGAQGVPHLLFALLTAAAYILGVVFAALTASTGVQWFHVPTASGFVGGFVAQVVWLNAITNAPLAKLRSE